MTKQEKEYQRDAREVGCVVCLLFLHVRSDGDIHHCVSGGRRIGESAVICLCPSHHRSGLNNATVTSRHPWRTAWQARYGSEEQLMARTQALVADRRRMAA